MCSLQGFNRETVTLGGVLTKWVNPVSLLQYYYPFLLNLCKNVCLHSQYRNTVF